MADLISRPLPWLTIRKAYIGRNKLQAFLAKYYEEEHYLTDPTCSSITAARATALRNHGLTNLEISLLEAALPLAGATNSAPVTYWMICYLYACPDLVCQLRQELDPLITRERTTATIAVTKIETSCPLLMSCYKETIRMRNSNVSPRYMIADTTISDSKGRSYLLKKGIDVQIASLVPQLRSEFWGPTVAEFDPTRFLSTNSADKEARAAEKKREKAYIPFGGGRHLCPGRAFALGEIMSVVATLLVGFEIEATGIGFNDVKAGVPKLGASTLKPYKNGEGTGFKMRRREGWEGVRWRYA